MFILFVLLVLLAVCVQCQQETFATNYLDNVLWKTKNIVYGVSSRDPNEEETFRALVEKTIYKFHKIFGNAVKFREEERYALLIKYDRYLFISEAEHEKCGRAWPSYIGSSHLILKSKPCDPNEDMKNMLYILGFLPVFRRMDRDNFIEMQWDNISPSFAFFMRKVPQLSNSTNEAFRTYDYKSILHPSAISDDAKDPTKPVFIPKNMSFWNDIIVPNSEREVTPTDIKQFQAVYGAGD